MNIEDLVDATLGINYAQGFDLNVDLYSVDVNGVVPPIVNPSDAKCHAYCCLISYQITLYILVLIKLLIFRLARLSMKFR